jgi:hypothetical protein
MSKLLYKIGTEGKESNKNNEVDSYYNTLEVVSNNIDEVNTRTEWVSTKHLDLDSNPIIQSYDQRHNNPLTGKFYNSLTWETIDHGLNGSTDIPISGIDISGKVVRIHFNIMHTRNSHNYESGDDYWWMKLELEIDGNWELAGYVARNSLSTFRGAYTVGFPINGYRRYGMSAVVMRTGQLTGARVRVKIEDNTKVLSFAEWDLSVKVIGA